MFQDDLLVRSPNGFELTLRGRKILDELEGLLPKMETSGRAHGRSIRCGRRATFAFPALTMFARSCSRVYAGSMRTGATKCTLNSIPGRAASRSWWNTGNWILFSTLMTGFCRALSVGKALSRGLGLRRCA